MKTSIIILSFNNWDLTNKCLDSIKKHTDIKKVEIIVIDNCSDRDTVAALKKYQGIKKIFNAKNVGFAKGCNQGAKEATGEILLFLNNDTEVTKGWLEPLLADLKDKKVAAVAPKLIFPDGLIQFAGVTFAEDKFPRHIYRGKKDFAGTNKRREFKALTAACLAIKKKAFDEVGGFDEIYKNGMEDIDLCFRLGEAGHKLIYDPKSLVIHYESASDDRLKHVFDNNDIFMDRWKDGIIPDEHRYLREDGISWLSIYYNDILKMAYYKDRYGTTPGYVLTLRYIVTIPHKFYTFFRLLFTGEMKTIKEKVQRKDNA
jgi:GT2 family glycosyltransferase